MLKWKLWNFPVMPKNFPVMPKKKMPTAAFNVATTVRRGFEYNVLLIYFAFPRNLSKGVYFMPRSLAKAS